MYQITLISTAQQKETFYSLFFFFCVCLIFYLYSFNHLFCSCFSSLLTLAYTKRSAMITWFIFEIVNRMTTTEQQEQQQRSHHDFWKVPWSSIIMFVLKIEDDIDLTSERVRMTGVCVCVFIPELANGLIAVRLESALIVAGQKWICSTNNEILKDDEAAASYICCVCRSHAIIRFFLIFVCLRIHKHTFIS